MTSVNNFNSVNKRIYIGNLPKKISVNNLKEIIPKGCEVSNIEIKHKQDLDNKIIGTYAFLDFNGSISNIESCCLQLSKKELEGNEITVQFARENFLERLQKERLFKKSSTLDSGNTSVKNNNSIKNNSITFDNEGKHSTFSKDNLSKSIMKAKHESKSKDKIKKNLKKPLHISNETMSVTTDITKSDSVTVVKQIKPTVIVGAGKKADGVRLKSLMEKSNIHSQQKDFIKHSLNLLASEPNKNKIIFNDDAIDVDNIEKNDSKQKTLFSSDSEDDGVEMFDFSSNKPSYKVVQTKYSTCDERFRMDDRFLNESDKLLKDESTDYDIENNSNEVSNLKKMVDSIIGNTTLKDKSLKTNNNDKLSARFDPLISEHNKFIIVKENDFKTDLSKKKNYVKESEKKPSVTTEKFYDISDDLRKTFEFKSECNFSLLELFGKGKKESPKDVIDEMSANPTSISVVGKNFLQTNDDEFDSSSGEDEPDDKKTFLKLDDLPDSNSVHKLTDSLFFHVDDERLISGLKFFKENLELKELHSTKRRKLKEIIGKKYKKNLQRSSAFRNKIGGKKRHFFNKRHRKNIKQISRRK